MSRDQQRLADYLGHILEAIKRIYCYTDDITEVTFFENQLIQDAVLRNLEIVGEASRNVVTHFPDFVAAYPSIPFASAYQMRNAIAHGYFKVDLQVVWNTIYRDLPSFFAEIENIRHL